MVALSPITGSSSPLLGDEKARQILEGARQVFLAQGFDAASMNDIARTAGVSKGTIYFHFDSKEALFEALIRAERQQQAEQCFVLDTQTPDIREALTDLGRSLVTMMMSPQLVAQVRTVIAVAAKFPRIGRAFYETGPAHGIEELAAYFETQTRLGKLATPEPRLAAIHFFQLCQGDVLKRVMFCTEDSISAQEVEQVVAAGVAVFLRAYGPANLP